MNFNRTATLRVRFNEPVLRRPIRPVDITPPPNPHRRYTLKKDVVAAHQSSPPLSWRTLMPEREVETRPLDGLAADMSRVQAAIDELRAERKGGLENLNGS
ncbi:ribosomal RNA large subunit methyltransferase G [Striga asiatica]|uniref:Ribosomal RNA large subunit methyltransferase G n=1 Tax=Striga asiatica TaxID=4170 RepID=A0A5A7P8A1_STRAF|nr:ribosomal RNA large subunit methyltransferase G [Striga asiatica]